MDLLNNLNTLISIIAGLVAIGSAIFGAIKYLQKKAQPARQQQTIQFSSSHNRSLYEAEPKFLSKLDWMEVLWNGLEDSFKAKDGQGWIPSLMIGFLGILFLSTIISSSKDNIVAIICLVVFVVLWFSANLLFYTYFVGRRIEKKVAEINKGRSQVLKNIQRY